MSKSSLSLSILALLLCMVFPYPPINSCEDARETGIHTLQYKSWNLDVICDMDTDGGGWLVILNRRGGYEDFYRPWDLYKDEGVGSPQTEYILPLTFLHDYLSSDAYELLEQMTEGSDYAWGLYSFLTLGSEEEKFSLKIGNQDSASNTGGDHWVYHKNAKFSTYDQDNDTGQNNCAIQYHSPGWFKSCHQVNPLGNYQDNSYARGISARLWKGYYVSLDTFSWKVRRSVCNSGFGSTCSSCSDGFTLPDRPLYHRVTCVKDCGLEGCRKCYDGFIEYCKACEPGYALTNKGFCRKREGGSGGGN